MSLFRRKKYTSGMTGGQDAGDLARRSLDFIAEGVMMVDENGLIKFANPAAATMTGYNDPATIVGLDYQLVVRLESAQGAPIESTQSALYIAIKLNRHLHTREYVLVSAQSERRLAIDLTCIPTGNERSDRIITFRDITTELAEEHEQAEFISTASHEMRTPVASIEGYLGLALNPQTATIDERAKKYLEAAHAASQHLGRLFKDLLDVTKLDDKRARTHLVPLDAVEAVKYIANEQAKAMGAKGLHYTFGNEGSGIDKKRIEQKIYMAVDYDFLHEIVDNLVGNAIKYTPAGGQISVAVRGDGDKVLISVADTGMGIPADDVVHIFQKFYRVDNSQTRQIGGTGLGLYLVKKRVEALGGRVWVESEYGKGSTFYVSLPRISESEYERMSIAYNNEKMVQSFSAPQGSGNGTQVSGVAAVGGVGAAPAVGGLVGVATSEQPASATVATPVVSQATPTATAGLAAPGVTQTASAPTTSPAATAVSQAPSLGATKPAATSAPAVTPTTTEPSSAPTATTTLATPAAAQTSPSPTASTVSAVSTTSPSPTASVAPTATLPKTATSTATATTSPSVTAGAAPTANPTSSAPATNPAIPSPPTTSSSNPLINNNQP